MTIKRYLKMDLPVGQSAFLWGGRKTGKSTFLKEAFPKSLFIDFLNSETLYKFTEKPYLLREIVEAMSPEQKTIPIIIDEVQKVPEILNDVHWLIENMKPISFILCGSSARKMRRQGVNLLGGRAWRYVFCPLAFPEIAPSEGTPIDLIHIFKTGLLPSHYLGENHIRQHMRAYIHDYLIQEVQQESVIRNMRAFLRFLDLMAFCHTEIINYSNLARDCAVDARTVKGYFEILEDMLLGTFIYPYFCRDKRDHLVAHPKFYFFDVGIINHMTKQNVSEVKGPLAGKMFEHYIYMELYAYKNLNQLDYPIQYWRTKAGHEVDFVLSHGQLAIECKISTHLQKKDLSGLLAFHSDFPDANLIIVCQESQKRVMTIDQVKITIYPIDDFLRALWTNTFSLQ